MRESDIIAPLGLMSIMGMLAGDKKSNLLQAQIDAYQKEQEKTVEDPVEENQDLETVSDEQKKIEYDKAVKEHEENFKENPDEYNLDFEPGAALMNLGEEGPFSGFGEKILQTGFDIFRYAKFPFLSALLEPTVLGDGTFPIDEKTGGYVMPDGTVSTLSFPIDESGMPILNKADGGLVPPLRGPMANGVGNLFKLK